MMDLTEKVSLWKEALNRGEVPAVEVSSQPRHGGGIFGMKP